MHGGEAGNGELAQARQRGRDVWPCRDIAQTLLQREDFLAAVIVCHGFALATVCAQVGTKEGAAMCLIEQNSVPIVGKVRGLKHVQAMCAKFDDALIRDSPGWPQGKISNRSPGSNRAAAHVSLGGQGEPVVQGTALVSLKV